MAERRVIMEFYEHFLVFPEGDIQPVDHILSFGDIVDINGNVFTEKTLDPYKIAYRVSGIKKRNHFKEHKFYYKLEILSSDEVRGEKKYLTAMEKKRKDKLDKVFDKLEKKIKKRRFK